MRPRPPDPPGSFGRAGLHLAGLTALAVAQPLFDLLSRNAEFFAVRGSSRADIVLFAVGVVVLPPLLLLGLEAVAGLWSTRAATVVHLVFAAALVGLLVLQVIRGADVRAALLVAAAAAVGAAGAFLYTRVRPVRMLLSVLAAAPLVFLGLFLLASPVSRLVFADAPEPRLADVPGETPVVMVVFDELPVVSLMDGSGGIDAVRYPNFARLAKAATWYRNTTTVHEWTTGAVPAILTGLRPKPDDLPLYVDHPDNLFTLLGGGYDLHATESQTHLCPAELCDEDRDPLPERIGSLLSDLSVVYGHLVLPAGLAADLPSISTEWGDFGGDAPVALLQEGPSRPGTRPDAYTGRDAEVRAFASGIRRGERGDRPGLFFLHSLLPHHPWEYLPDGKSYASTLSAQPGLVDERWVGDPELAIQAEQRHLLQVGFADLALGRILDRLEQTGLYDDALVVVAADHGVSFRPHGERRRVNTGNMEDIAFVPFFLKAPGQRSGETVDAHVRTTDVLPTIADVLGIEVPWRTDGRSAVGRAAGAYPDVVVETPGGDQVVGQLDDLVARRAAALERQVDLFGEGDDEPGLYGIGPRPELLGRPVDGLSLAAAGGGPTFTSYGDTDYDPDSPVAPVRIAGRIEGAPAGEDVAIAVNGRIVAVTRSFELGGDVLVSAVVPESAFRPGENGVRVYLVEGAGEDPTLRELAPGS
ncbi:MAG TPA: sulfatase-like hydrolase/transferase [Gaiellaceae bacterium]